MTAVADIERSMESGLEDQTKSREDSFEFQTTLVTEAGMSAGMK